MKHSAKIRNKRWTEKELLVAMNLYCRLSFGQFNHKQAEIIEVAQKLGRTPSALSMKLCNLASLDPAHQEKGVQGLTNASEADRKIWQDFQNDWKTMALKSEAVFLKLTSESIHQMEKEQTEYYGKQSPGKFSEESASHSLEKQFWSATIIPVA